jgi:hypothetical protein
MVNTGALDMNTSDRLLNRLRREFTTVQVDTSGTQFSHIEQKSTIGNSSTEQYVVVEPDISMLSTETPIDIKDIKESFSILLKHSDFLKGILRRFMRENNDFVKQLLLEIAENQDPQPIIIRHIDREMAKKEIKEYIHAHLGCRTSEIIDNLNLDPIFTMEILKELKTEKCVSSKPVESN